MNDVELLITVDNHAVCSAHFERYIDDPAVPATDFDYHLALQRSGTALRCVRCEVLDERERDSMATDFLRANRAAWGDGDRDRVEPPSEVGSCFSTYLEHPSHAA